MAVRPADRLAIERQEEVAGPFRCRHVGACRDVGKTLGASLLTHRTGSDPTISRKRLRPSWSRYAMTAEW